MTEPLDAADLPPVRRGPSRHQARLLVITVGSVITSIVLLFLALQLAKNPTVQKSVGDEVFRVGEAKRLAPEIAEHGPLLFQDLLQRSRDLYVQHLGDDPEKGWLAFEAHAADQPRRCVVQWNQTTKRFRDPCTTTTYPADGEGLTSYPVEVELGTVVVDLR